MQITKYILPVVVGAMGGMMLITLGETTLHNIYPDPVSQMPPSAYLFLVVNYILCSFLAGVASSLVAKRISSLPAVVVGIVMTLGGLYNSVSLHHPMWFTVINFFLYLPFAYFGFIAVRKKETLFSND